MTTESGPATPIEPEETAFAPLPPAPGQPPPPPPGPRRLTRSAHDRMLGGVAGGLAEYFAVDPVLVRIAIVVLTLVSGGVFVVLYVAAWIIMPSAAPLAAGTAAPGAAPAARPPGGSRSASLFFGVLLIAAGAIGLLIALDLPTPPWDVMLAALLILVGVAMVVEARRRMSGGLLTIGIVLSLMLAAGVGSGPSLELDSGFGDQRIQPASVAALEDGYSHAFGSMTVDLRSLDLPTGTTELDVSIAFGELNVLIPSGVGLRVDGQTLFGSTEIAGRDFDGVAIDHDYVSGNYDDAETRLRLHLRTAFGSAVVR